MKKRMFRWVRVPRNKCCWWIFSFSKLVETRYQRPSENAVSEELKLKHSTVLFCSLFFMFSSHYSPLLLSTAGRLHVVLTRAKWSLYLGLKPKNNKGQEMRRLYCNLEHIWKILIIWVSAIFLLKCYFVNNLYVW